MDNDIKEKNPTEWEISSLSINFIFNSYCNESEISY